MIRAIIEGGNLRPLDPLPVGYHEGQVVGLEISAQAEADELDIWSSELDRLGPARYEPGEREQVQAVLQEADTQAKEQVRPTESSLLAASGGWLGSTAP